MLKYLLSFLLLAAPVVAGERTYTFDLGPNQSTPYSHPSTHYVQQWTQNIELPHLPPSVGDLQEIEIVIEQYVEYQFHYEMIWLNHFAGTPNTWDRINHIVRIVDNNNANELVWAVNSFTRAGDSFTCQTPFDGRLDFGGTSGYTSGINSGFYASRNIITGSDCDYYNQRKNPFLLEVKGRLRFQFQSYEPVWLMGVTDFTWTRIKVIYKWT